MPPRGLLELWLQHAKCSTPATGAEVEVISPGKIFMTHGWGEVARVCRTEVALTIHFEYDGAFTMFFKVFDEEGRRLECCPGGGRRDDTAAGAGPAAGLASSSSSSSDGQRWLAGPRAPRPLPSPVAPRASGTP